MSSSRAGAAAFASGPSPRPLLSIPGLPPVAALICYEAIFPAAIVQGPSRPGLLLNVTNDGWFGDYDRSWQHFHQARVRAVEEGCRSCAPPTTAYRRWSMRMVAFSQCLD